MDKDNSNDEDDKKSSTTTLSVSDRSSSTIPHTHTQLPTQYNTNPSQFMYYHHHYNMQQYHYQQQQYHYHRHQQSQQQQQQQSSTLQQSSIAQVAISSSIRNHSPSRAPKVHSPTRSPVHKKHRPVCAGAGSTIQFDDTLVSSLSSSSINDTTLLPPHQPSSTTTTTGDYSEGNPDEICNNNMLTSKSDDFIPRVLKILENKSIKRYLYLSSTIGQYEYSCIPEEYRYVFINIKIKDNNKNIKLNLHYMEVVESGEVVGLRNRFNNDETKAYERILKKTKAIHGKYTHRNLSNVGNKPSTIQDTNADGIKIECIRKITYNDGILFGRVYRAYIPTITTDGSVLLYYDNSKEQKSYNDIAKAHILESLPTQVLTNCAGAYRDHIQATSNMKSVITEYEGTILQAAEEHSNFITKINKDAKSKNNAKEAYGAKSLPKEPQISRIDHSTTTIPYSHYSRKKDRHDSFEDKKVRLAYNFQTASSRVSNVSNQVNKASKENGLEVSINTILNEDGSSFTEETKNALMPFCESSKSYEIRNKDRNNISAEDRWNEKNKSVTTVYWNRESYQISKFAKKIVHYHNKDEGTHTYTPVLLDDNDVLGRGKKQMYLLVSNHVSDDRLINISECCENTIGDWNSFVAIVQLLCTQDVYKITDVEEEDVDELIVTDTTKEETDALVSLTEEYIKTALTALVHHLDFENGSINDLLRIPWIFWNLMAAEFHDFIDPIMQSRMYDNLLEVWNRVSEMNPDIQEGSADFIDKFKEEVGKAKMFHYLIIMLVSGSRTDGKCRECYEKIMYKTSDVKSFLQKIGMVDQLHAFEDILTEILRGSSLGGSTANSIVEAAVRCAIDFNGGIPDSNTQKSMYQVGSKKSGIALNTKAVFTGNIDDFVRIGTDTHVLRLFAIIIKIWLKHNEKNVPDDDQLKKRARILAKLIDRNIGVYANEVIGQLAQFMSNRRDIGDIFNTLAQKNKLFEEVNKEWKAKAKKKKN